jgi:hypothetical protein
VIIKVKVKDVYGKATIYPICDKARDFAGIAGTTTITRHCLRLIKGLGYTVEVIQEVTL